MTRTEFQSQVQIIQNTWRPTPPREPRAKFLFYNRNRDNRSNRLEWPGVRALFERLDRNRAGFFEPE